jgi:hypothetical protein
VKEPFLIQVACRDLVNALNEQNRTRATLADVERALDSVLTTGAAYFQDLWSNPRDSDDAQRAVMRAIATRKDLSSLADLTGLDAALRKLVHRDILGVIASEAKQSPPSDLEIASSQTPLLAMTDRYKFRVELVRRWVERNT